MLLSVIWLLVISPRLFHRSMGTHVLPRRLLLSFIVKFTVTWPDIEFSRVHYHILLGSEGKVGMSMCKLQVVMLKSSTFTSVLGHFGPESLEVHIHFGLKDLSHSTTLVFCSVTSVPRCGVDKYCFGCSNCSGHRSSLQRV